MERFRFSSMKDARGGSGGAEWKDEDGQFSMERFRAFSSMNNGKGLPEQAKVKAVLAWPEWKDEDGQFSMERFRAFSSMNSSRGLPAKRWPGRNGKTRMAVQYGAVPRLFVHEQLKGLARTGGGESGGLAGMERREWPVQYGGSAPFRP